jgi:hypothetical protein
MNSSMGQPILQQVESQNKGGALHWAANATAPTRLNRDRNGVTTLAVVTPLGYIRLDREHVGAVADAFAVDTEFVEDRQQQV